jgi:ATP-dependent helicase Lhr and Lhr-like helicase
MARPAEPETPPPGTFRPGATGGNRSDSDNLRRRLVGSFNTFFGRFDALNPVQRQALPAILDGADVLITAPTASGKTEAFAAPAAEAIIKGRRGGARAIFVSPTRALANDLKRRLEARLDDLSVSFGRYTGEHKERIAGRLAEIVVTTPEALDSLLARRPRALRHVRLVVLDEIHVVDGSPRGDQLRVLLHRLENAADHRPQRVVVSATVEDPAATASRYLEDPRVVAVDAARTIRAKVFHGRTPRHMAEHLRYLTQQGFRKILVFVNRRADVEDYATGLKGRCVFGDQVFPHHGSLSQPVRERTEQHFLKAQAAVAFATMTLELGIDIGSVDYVLLAGPPADVSSLLQRIGRGARRTDASRMGYAVKDAGEQLICRVLLESAARGQLLGGPYAVRPGVVVQQALVIAGAEDWIDAPRLAAAIPPTMWEELAPTGPRKLLDALVKAELLEPPRSGRYVLAADADRRYQRGVLHSNIGNALASEVVDRLTGDVVGYVELVEDHHLNLGGGGRKVVRSDPGRILTDRVGQGKTPQFAPKGKPCCGLAQARAVVQRVGLASNEVQQVQVAGSTLLLHGLGDVGGLMLTQALKKQHGTACVERSSPYVIHLTGPLTDIPRPSDSEAANFVTTHEGQLARRLAMGPWHRHLPVELRCQSTYRASGLDRVCALLATAELTTNDEGDPAVEFL